MCPRHREPREAAGGLGKHLPPARSPPPHLHSTPALLLPRPPEPRVEGHATHSGSSLSSQWLQSLALRAVSTACPWLFQQGRGCRSSHFFNALCGPFNCCKIQWWLREQGLKPRTSSKLEALLTSMSKVIEHTALPGEHPLSGFVLTLTVFNADRLFWGDCGHSSSLP